MKIIKITIIIAVILTIGIVTYSKLNSYSHKKDTLNNVVNTDKWKNKAPQLFTNTGYAKLMSSMPIKTNKNLPESVAILEGQITNPFGIRDDILDFIINKAQNDNPLVMKAALKMAQDRQLIYYDNLSESEALKVDSNDSLLLTCLLMYTDNFEITDGIEKRMRNTPARNAHLWAVDRKYFSWKVLGSGLSVADEKIACQKGEF